MFEFDQYSAVDPGPAVRPSEEISFASGIRKRSLLIWSEHCIECAAPECYQSCSLYTPRPDDRCRRFDVGMRRNNHFRGKTGAAADIIFGKWGKLEARGNTILLPNWLVSIVETVLPRIQPLVNAFGRLVRRFGGSAPWTSLSFELTDYYSKRLHKASNPDKESATKPDGFLIEIYNPAEQDQAVKFSCAVSGSQMLSVPANGKMAFPYWKKLTLVPGYNRFFIPYAKLSAIVESQLRYNISFTPEQESGVRLVFISADFVTMDTPEALVQEPVTDELAIQNSAAASDQQTAGVASSQSLSGEQSKPAVKCVIFDLDNTLWEGVLVEGAVSLKSSIPALFKALDKRGILISVASKNNESEALEHLSVLGLKEYLIYPVINWNQKSQNIKWLAKKLSIGTDTLLFIDDSEFEREEVSTSIPDIEVLADTAIDTLLEHPRLQGGSTNESGNRRIMYQQQAVRNEVAVQFGEDYLGFLKSSEIVVNIGMVKEHQKARVTELLQRTNQLNFSGVKYTSDAVDELLQDESTDKHVIHCSDKYGDYGLVGFSITRAEKQDIKVQDFMLSCRVQGKLIEKAFFSYLVNKYTDGKADIAVNFLPTGRNGLAQSVLQEIGFTLSEGNNAQLQVEPGQLDVDFLELQVEAQNTTSSEA